MNQSEYDQDETNFENLENLENMDISKIIKSKYKSRRQGISQNILGNIKNSQIQPDNEYMPTQINQTAQSEIFVSGTDAEQKLITFRCQQEKMNKKINKKQEKKTLFSQYNQCRICGDGDTEESPLIKACECVRSRYYVHEDCLKQQILDEYNYKIRNAKCSSCQMYFNMIIEGNFIYLPKLGWQQSKDKIPLVCLTIFLLVLIIVVVLLSIRLGKIKQSNRQSFLNSKLFIILFIIICGFIGCLLIYLIVMIIKNVCYVEKITKWKIIPYVVKQPSFVIQPNIEIDQKGVLKLKQMIQAEKENQKNNDLTKSEYIQTNKINYKRYFTSKRFSNEISQQS